MRDRIPFYLIIAISGPHGSPYLSRTSGLDRFCHLAQLEFLQLSSRCLGDFGEHDEVGTFVVGEMLTTPGDQLLRGRRGARLELDKGAGRLTPSLVWLGDYRGSLDRWMIVKHILDLDRRNVF